MPSRSQRHLRAVRGVDSGGSAGPGAALAITSPEAGNTTTPVTLTATATSSEGMDIAHLVRWTSDVDGLLGVGAELEVAMSVDDHDITAEVGGLSDTVAITVTG